MADTQRFFDTFVQPAVDDWRADTASLRKAMDVACHLNAMIDHFWHEHKDINPANVFDQIESVGQFRHHICREHRQLGFIRDIANAHKHCELDRDGRSLTNSSQTDVRAMGWGEAEYGIAEFGEDQNAYANSDD